MLEIFQLNRIEIESTAKLNKEHLNHSIIGTEKKVKILQKKLKFVKNKKKNFQNEKERLELITFELVF